MGMDPSIKTQLPCHSSQCHLWSRCLVSEHICSTLLMFWLELGALIPLPVTGPVSLSCSAGCPCLLGELLEVLGSLLSKEFWAIGSSFSNLLCWPEKFLLGKCHCNFWAQTQFVVLVLHGCGLLLRMGGCFSQRKVFQVQHRLCQPGAQIFIYLCPIVSKSNCISSVRNIAVWLVSQFENKQNWEESAAYDQTKKKFSKTSCIFRSRWT